MAVQEIVRVLGSFVEDEGETLRERFGPEAEATAQDIVRVLSLRLGEESPHVNLWEAFQADPRDRTAELIGVLEAMVEADPALARRLDGFAQELHEVMGPPAPSGPSTGRYMAEVGGDALDTAVEPENEPGPQDRVPYHPDTASNVDYKAGTDRGTYLYGNVKAGKDDVGRETGAETFDYAEREVRPTRLAGLSGVPGLFQELITAVTEHPALNEAKKEQILTELQVVREQVNQAEVANPDSLARHLLTLQETSPDIGEVTLQALASVDLAPPVQEAVEKVRAQLPPETEEG